MSRSEGTKRNFQISLVVVVIGVMASVNVQAADEAVILHPGHLSGSMLVGDQQLTDVTVRAIDIETGVMASVTVTVPIGVDKISYQLSVEGNRKYHITAEAHIIRHSVPG